MAGLKGGGARARKKQRRLPSTPAEIKRSWAAYSKTLKWKRGDDPFTRTVGLEYSSKGRKITTPAIEGSIVKGRKGKCVFFVVHDPEQRKPYEVTSLCQGGKMWTGTHSYESLREAKDQAKWLASRDRSLR